MAELTEAGKHSGKFLCKECQSAWKDIARNMPKAEAKKPAAPAKEAAPKPAPAAAKPAEPKPAPAAAKPAGHKPEGSGGLDFK